MHLIHTTSKTSTTSTQSNTRTTPKPANLGHLGHTAVAPSQTISYFSPAKREEADKSIIATTLAIRQSPEGQWYDCTLRKASTTPFWAQSSAFSSMRTIHSLDLDTPNQINNGTNTAKDMVAQYLIISFGVIAGLISLMVIVPAAISTVRSCYRNCVKPLEPTVSQIMRQTDPFADDNA